MRFRHEIWCGNKRQIYGTFITTDGSTGGVIDTNLHVTESMVLQLTGSEANANALAVDQSFPCDKYVTIKTPADVSGLWCATGV